MTDASTRTPRIPATDSVDTTSVESTIPTATRVDPVERALGVAAILVGAVILGALLSLLWFGMLQKPTPRTATERDLSVYGALVKTTHGNPNLWAHYIAALTDAKQYLQADAALTAAYKDVGKSPIIVYIDAGVQNAEGKQDAAISKADEAIALATAARVATTNNYTSKGVHMAPAADLTIINSALLKARIYGERGKWDEAAAALTVALKEDATMSDVLTMRGDAYRHLGNAASARADYTTALKYAPGYAPASQGLSQIGAK